MQQLIAYNTTILQQLDRLLHQLRDVELCKPCPLLFGSSIGQHFRHILEFYGCLLAAEEGTCFSYDRRQRNPLIETEVIAARASAVRSIGLLRELRVDRELMMESELPGTGDRTALRTTLLRELVYLADHSVHHLAMVRIALEHELPHVVFPEHLGVAASTRNHKAR